jgi:hypothetical protein
MYIRLCDYCGKPVNVDSQQGHVGEFKADIWLHRGKSNYVFFRHNFDLCVECVMQTGLGDILEKIQNHIEKNEDRKVNFKKQLKRLGVMPQ